MQQLKRDREPPSDRAAAVGQTIDFSSLRAKALELAFPPPEEVIPVMRIGRHAVGLQVTRDHFSFGKAPIWLAFVTVRDMLDRIIPTDSWTSHRAELLIDLLRRALDPAGDPGRERIFRMQPAICRQRALTSYEVAQIPADRLGTKVGHLAGGPVDLLFSYIDVAAGKPCEAPIRAPLEFHRPIAHADMWVPLDCGKCPPCIAREKIRDELEIEGQGAIVTI